MDTRTKDIRPIAGYSVDGPPSTPFPNSSLTAPWDRTQKPNPLDSQYPPLTEPEFIQAFEELRVDLTGKKFRSIDRRYKDPFIPRQLVSLFSFIPSRGARPDSKGVYGYAKIRGTYETITESAEREADLIKNHDSYHKIYTVYTGAPFPITLSSKFSEEINEVELHKNISQEISHDVKQKREAEKKEIETIQQRAKNLQEDTNFEAIDDLENYTTLRNKKAQLIWHYLEIQKKLVETRVLMKKAFKQVVDEDLAHPDFKNQFYEKFVEARVKAGIKDEKLEGSFMAYLVEDRIHELDFDPYELVNADKLVNETEKTPGEN
jgi:gas vesicle protein